MNLIAILLVLNAFYKVAQCESDGDMVYQGSLFKLCPDNGLCANTHFILKFQHLAEIDENGNEIGREADNFVNYGYTWTTPTIETDENGVSRTKSTTSYDFTIGGDPGQTSTMEVTTYLYHGDSSIVHANQAIDIPTDNLKFEVKVGEWPWLNSNNKLRFVMRLKVLTRNGRTIEAADVTERTVGANGGIVRFDMGGSEGLTKLTSSGSLPKVGARYAEASAIHHAVEGMETIEKVAKELGATTTTLDKFGKTAGANKATVNNDGSVSGEITVVKVSNDANPADVDSIVASAIKNANIENVVLTSVRGLSEVKFQRDLLAKQKFYGAKDKSSRRKLEDAAQGNNYYDQDVIAFVNFTPNIFSGLMFFFFFATVTYIGIGCMGAIAGQEVYVTKYPTIGREA